MSKKLTIVIVSIGLIVLALFVFFSFRRQERLSIVGNYYSISPTMADKIKFALGGIECFYAGRELRLLRDSTFTLIDSATIQSGTWHLKKNLIDLHFLSSKYVSDSLFQKFGKPAIALKDFSLTYDNPDLFVSSKNDSVGCVEIFRIESF